MQQPFRVLKWRILHYLPHEKALSSTQEVPFSDLKSLEKFGTRFEWVPEEPRYVNIAILDNLRPPSSAATLFPLPIKEVKRFFVSYQLQFRIPAKNTTLKSFKELIGRRIDTSMSQILRGVHTAYIRPRSNVLRIQKFVIFCWPWGDILKYVIQRTWGYPFKINSFQHHTFFDFRFSITLALWKGESS